MKLKQYCKLYCKILSNVTNEPKRLNYTKQIINSHNKIKTTQNIINAETGEKFINDDIFFVKRKDDDENNHCKVNFELFNNFFNGCRKKIYSTLNNNTVYCKNNINLTQYLSQIFKNYFPNIKINNTTTKETENIVNSLKLENSHGYDEITMRILKISAPFIRSPPCYICNKSLSLGTFPVRLKYSIVTHYLRRVIKTI